jgi:hypothetical protein
MQVIAEAYSLMKALGCPRPRWRHVRPVGRRRARLVPDRHHRRHPRPRDEDGIPLVENILDAAGQKGTGKWTVISSMDLGQPVSLVAEAVYARIVSSFKDLRVAATAGPGPGRSSRCVDRRPARRAVRLEDRLLRPGVHAVAAGLRRERLGPRSGQVASLWRAGASSGHAFLDDVMRAFGAAGLDNLLLDPTSSSASAGVGSGLAANGRLGGGRGCPGAGLCVGPGLLRRVPLGGVRQPHPGPARLLRRPHLRTGRPGSRRVVPHGLDRPGGDTTAGSYGA